MRKLVAVAIALGASVVGAAGSVRAATSQNISTAATSGWTVSGGGAVGATPFSSGPDALSVTSDGTAQGTPVTGLSLASFDGYWVADYSFVLPPDATNPSLAISNFFADDRSILTLNGVVIANTGVNGPGAGSMVESDGSAPVAFTFTNTSSDTVASDFVLGGVNSLEVVVNNTGGGIAADLADLGPSNGTNFGLNAALSYDSASVPLPASFGSGLVTMLGVVGFGALRRRTASDNR